ncbi:MAG: class I SAM-dependent methyltransferase [Sphingomonadales bacterium]
MTIEEDLFPGTEMPDGEWWSALWPDPHGVIAKLGIKPGMTALDLCCGDGYFTLPMAELLEGRVYALDIDPELLEKARSRIDRSGTTVAGWICADAMDMAGLIPEELDLVLITNTFHGVPDKPAMARAVAAVLKPGGRLIIINWRPSPREETIVLGEPGGPKTGLRMWPLDVRKVVQPAGFRFTRLVDLPPYHYGVIFRKSPHLE